MARVRIHGANTIHSLGLVGAVVMFHTNTGNHAKMETEGAEFHTLAAAQ